MKTRCRTRRSRARHRSTDTRGRPGEQGGERSSKRPPNQPPLLLAPHSPRGSGGASSPHTVGPTDSDADPADRAAAGSGLVALAARSDGLYRLLVREDALLEWTQVIAYLLVITTAVAAAPHLWRRKDHVATVVVVGLGLIPRQHWRRTVVGSAAHRLRDTRDRVTKSTRRAHASQRRADRTIDTSRTSVRRPLRSPGAAHRSTPHTPHPAKDTLRVLRCHCLLLQRPADFPRRP